MVMNSGSGSGSGSGEDCKPIDLVCVELAKGDSYVSTSSKTNGKNIFVSYGSTTEIVVLKTTLNSQGLIPTQRDEWDQVGPAIPVTGMLVECAINLVGNIPHVAWLSTSGGKLCVSYVVLMGNNWETVGDSDPIECVDGSTSGSIQLLITPDGVPVIVYFFKKSLESSVIALGYNEALRLWNRSIINACDTLIRNQKIFAFINECCNVCVAYIVWRQGPVPPSMGGNGGKLGICCPRPNKCDPTPPEEDSSKCYIVINCFNGNIACGQGEWEESEACFCYRSSDFTTACGQLSGIMCNGNGSDNELNLVVSYKEDGDYKLGHLIITFNMGIPDCNEALCDNLPPEKFTLICTSLQLEVETLNGVSIGTTDDDCGELCVVVGTNDGVLFAYRVVTGMSVNWCCNLEKDGVITSPSVISMSDLSKVCAFTMIQDGNSVQACYPVPEDEVIVICVNGEAKIHTPRGQVPIKYIRQGDKVFNKDGEQVRVKNMIRSHVDKTLYLVHFQKDSLAPGVPAEDTYVTTTHIIDHGGKKKEAKRFVNNRNIRLINKKMDYIYNLEFFDNDYFLANGIPMQSHYNFEFSKFDYF